MGFGRGVVDFVIYYDVGENFVRFKDEFLFFLVIDVDVGDV